MSTQSDTPLTDAVRDDYRGDTDGLCRALIRHSNDLERANAALKEHHQRDEAMIVQRTEEIRALEAELAKRPAVYKDWMAENAAQRAEVEELRNVLGQTRYTATQAMDEVRAAVGAPRGADDKSSNRAVDYVRAEVERLQGVVSATRESAINAMEEIRCAAGAPNAKEDTSPNRAVDYVAELRRQNSAMRAEVERLKADVSKHSRELVRHHELAMQGARTWLHAQHGELIAEVDRLRKNAGNVSAELVNKTCDAMRWQERAERAEAIVAYAQRFGDYVKGFDAARATVKEEDKL